MGSCSHKAVSHSGKDIHLVVLRSNSLSPTDDPRGVVGKPGKKSIVYIRQWVLDLCA